MPTLTRPTRATTTAAPAAPVAPASPLESTSRSLGDAVALASAAVLGLDLSDPKWQQVGPLLTAFVDAVRRAADGTRSCIGADEVVPPVLRLRELGRLAQRTAASHDAQPVEVAACLRSLQIATHQ